MPLTRPPPAPKTEGYPLAGRWGVNILEDARHWIGLLQYNLFGATIQEILSKEKNLAPKESNIGKAQRTVFRNFIL